MALKPETVEQIKLFDWIRMNPKLRYCSLHIPNEGKRSPVMGNILKRMGMRGGVSDIFIAYPTTKYHGLWIELKAKNAAGQYNKPTIKQIVFIEDMRIMGYEAIVCNGADMAINVIMQYLQAPMNI